MLKFFVRLVVVAVCCAASAGYAFAEGFALYEYSARGVALSGSVMARKADPSAVAYNPALLTRLPGTQASAGLTFVYPRGKMTWHDSDLEETRLKHSLWAIPNAYFTHQINDDWFFGVGEFSRYGLGFEYPHNWPGRFNIYEVSLMSGSLNPVLAWKATDKLSLAGGVEIVYVNLDLKKRAKTTVHPATGTYMEVDSNIQNADAWGIGGNLAAHYQFNEQWGLGMQYRSQVRVHAYGDVQWTYMGLNGPAAASPALNQAAQAGYKQTFVDGTADAVVILPDSLAAGLSYAPIPTLSFEVGAVWTRWSTFNSLNIHLPSPLKKSNSMKNWKDTWRLNAGAEWDVLDWMTLRLGYSFDQSPMTEQYADYLVPTANRNIYSGGVGFKWNAWTLDFAYAYIDPKERNYNANPDSGVLRSKPDNSYTQLFSVSLGYEF